MYGLYEDVPLDSVQFSSCVLNRIYNLKQGVYPSFCSMKLLGVFLLSPGWDGSPSQDYP